MKEVMERGDKKKYEFFVDMFFLVVYLVNIVFVVLCFVFVYIIGVIIKN